MDRLDVNTILCDARKKQLREINKLCDSTEHMSAMSLGKQQFIALRKLFNKGMLMTDYLKKIDKITKAMKTLAEASLLRKERFFDERQM